VAERNSPFVKSTENHRFSGGCADLPSMTGWPTVSIGTAQAEQAAEKEAAKQRKIAEAEAEQQRQQAEQARHSVTGLQAWADYAKEGTEVGFTSRGP